MLSYRPRSGRAAAWITSGCFKSQALATVFQETWKCSAILPKCRNCSSRNLATPSATRTYRGSTLESAWVLGRVGRPGMRPVSRRPRHHWPSPGRCRGLGRSSRRSPPWPITRPCVRRGPRGPSPFRAGPQHPRGVANHGHSGTSKARNRPDVGREAGGRGDGRGNGPEGVRRIRPAQDRRLCRGLPGQTGHGRAGRSRRRSSATSGRELDNRIRDHAADFLIEGVLPARLPESFCRIG